MPARRRVGRPKKKRTTLRGKGIRDWFKKAYSWTKDKVSGLWNSNKDKLRDQAIRLANQAKDKAIQYAQEKKILSNAVNRILPSRYGIDKIASNYVATKTGMGRKRRVGRPRKYGGMALRLQYSRPHLLRGGGFFGNLWSGVKNLGGKVVAPIAQKLIVPMAQKALTTALGGGRKRRVTRRRKTGGAKKRVVHRRRRLTGRGGLGGILGSMLLPF